MSRLSYRMPCRTAPHFTRCAVFLPAVLGVLLVIGPAPIASATHCDGGWASHTQPSDISCSAVAGTTIWYGSINGGVYEWDTVSETARVYTYNENCLPNNSIEDIAVDVAGNVWAATHLGLGKRPAANGPNDPWEVFDTSNSGLTDNFTTAVAAEPSGGIWVGTFDGGLFFFDGNTWTNYNTSNSPLGDNFITSLAVDLSGNIWMGTFSAFAYRFDGVSTWTHFDLAATNSPGGCGAGSMPAEDLGFLSSFVKVLGVNPVNGEIWFDNIDDGFCNLNGTTRFDGLDWDTFTPTNSGIFFRTEDVGFTPAGDTWFASLNGVQRLDGGGITSFPGGPFSVRAVDGIGEVQWFGTSFGPVDLTEGVFTFHEPTTMVDGQANDIVFRDLGGGNIEAWVATGAALQRYDGQSWFALTPSNSSISTNSINALAVDADNSLWVGPSPSGQAVQHVVNDTWTDYTTANSGLISTAISAIAVDPVTGDKWFGDRFSSGLASFDDLNWSTFTSDGNPFQCNAPNGVPGRPVKAIEIDGNGTKWIGSGCGLTRLDGGVWTTFNTDDGLVNNNVNDIALSANGDVWVATTGGVSRFDGLAFTSWLQQFFVTTVAVDQDGIVWATLNDVGAAAFDGTNWVLIAVSDGLLNDRTPSSTAIHPNGDVWFGTQVGISIFKQSFPIVYGDINLDGVVDVVDGAALANALVGQPGSPGELLRSDLNFDGTANALDITTFLEILFPPD